MPSEQYTARIIYTMELDGSITEERFGDPAKCLEIRHRIVPESDQIRALRLAAERGDHFPGSDF